jgi:hypothetical protein
VGHITIIFQERVCLYTGCNWLKKWPVLGFCDKVDETPVCIKYKEYYNQPIGLF